MTQQEAYELGKTAYINDQPAAPICNPVIQDAIKGAKVGEKSTADIFKAYSRGFRDAATDAALQAIA